MNIQLIHNFGFKWAHENGIYAKGYIYDSDGGYYKEGEIVSHIAKYNSKELIEFLKNANGSFAIVWKKGNEVVLSVDRIRSIPIFYYCDQKEIIISDDVFYIANYKKIDSFDELTRNFIQLGDFAPGSKTLFSPIFQLVGGQILHVENSLEPLLLKPLFYCEHTHDRNKNNSQGKLEERFENVLNNTFKRLVQSVKNKTIVIPLSGGSDSRLNAAMLKKLNYENVICYTYGRPESYEAKIAEKVAKALNYPWYFINYNSNQFEKYFDSISADYRRFAGNYSCTPLEQEYFAVRELTESKLIPKDAIFVPGYCADLPAGSYFPNKMQLELLKERRSYGKEFIIEKHFKKHKKNPGFVFVENELTKLFGTPKWYSLDEFISSHENWFTINKVSKYAVNGIRTYEFFGYEWRLPFWDNEFINFFYEIPNEERIDKKFYQGYLSNFLFKQFNIDFTPQTLDKHFTHDSPLNTLKYFMPGVIKKIAKHILINKQDRDVNALSGLFDLVNQKIYDGSFKGKEKDVNYILSCWYLQEAELLLKNRDTEN